ncbi:hypothetical protein Lal_00032217 [Lupinus albus]|nr:hypothetical protein Lal_00032217 [Lupinus albus]
MKFGDGNYFEEEKSVEKILYLECENYLRMCASRFHGMEDNGGEKKQMMFGYEIIWDSPIDYVFLPYEEQNKKMRLKKLPKE